MANVNDNSVSELGKQLIDLKKNVHRTRLMEAVICIFAVSTSLFSILLYGHNTDVSLRLFVCSIWSCLLFLPVQARRRHLQVEQQATQNEFDLLQHSTPDSERRAERLFRNHQFELKRYYDQTLAHSSLAFIIGILCILVGFGVIGFALSVFSRNEKNPNRDIIAILAATSGIMSNFIGVVYLKMYAETARALTDFHTRLVLTHHVHFSSFLVSKLEGAIRQDTLAKLAIALVTVPEPGSLKGHYPTTDEKAGQDARQTPAADAPNK